MHLRDPGFSPLVEWLQASLDNTKNVLMILTGTEAISRAQGAAKELSNLLELIRDSHTLAEKFRR